MKSILFQAILVILVMNTSFSQTEDFEGETNGATTFTTSSLSFTTTGDQLVEVFLPFGCGGSATWLGTGFGDGGSSGSFGSFKVTNVSDKFIISTASSWCAWTSNDDGNTFASGDVKFIGTLAAGGTIEETITISPPNNNTFDNITFSSGIWDNQELTEFESEIVSDINYLSLDNIVFAQLILPVELISFIGENEKYGIKLKWETASELDNEGYEIQQSIDGIKWNSLDFVKGSGTSNELNNYEYVHKRPSLEINYYRLKQIDFDGNYEYSKVISVRNVGDNNIKIYPNPTDGEIEVIGVGEAEVTIINSLGKIAKEQSLINQGLDISDLPKGLYFISINSDNKLIMEKIIKE